MAKKDNKKMWLDDLRRSQQWVDREAKRTQREAREATKNATNDWLLVTSQVPGNPSRGNHIRRIKDGSSLEVKVECQRTATALSIQMWRDTEDPVSYPEGTNMVSIYLVNTDEETVKLNKVGRQDQRRRAMLIFEGAFEMAGAFMRLLKFSTHMAEQYSTDTLQASSADDPFYMDEVL